jgi:acyl carrier protein
MAESIAQFIAAAHPGGNYTEEEILASEDLFADGYLDSLLNLKLLLHFEAKAGKRIPALQMSRNNFRSVASIANLLTSYNHDG